MITGFKIISLSAIGEAGLQKNLDEFGKLPPHARFMWNNLYSRTVTQNPLTLVVRVKSSPLKGMLHPDDLTRQLHRSMKSEGAKKNIDYKIEVQKQ